MSTSIALILSAALIAVALLFVFRWEVSSTSTLTFRLDRWTGHVTMCNETNDTILAALNAGEALKMKCAAD